MKRPTGGSRKRADEVLLKLPESTILGLKGWSKWEAGRTSHRVQAEVKKKLSQRIAEGG